MTPGRIGWELSTLAVLCVLTIFLFPATQGPYSVVHGPATALQAARAAARLHVAIVQAALKSTGNCLVSPLAALSWMSPSKAEFRSSSLSESSTILRCWFPPASRYRTAQFLLGREAASRSDSAFFPRGWAEAVLL